MRTRFVLFGAIVPLSLTAIGIGWAVHAERKADIPDTANPPFDRLADLEVAQDHEIGSVFRANYNFPNDLPAKDRPWEAYDYKTQSAEYMQAVLSYVMKGQGSPPQWATNPNPARRWYHMPWMGPGDRGREFTHGFTPEHRVYLRDLGVTDDRRDHCRQTWAISYYNPTGGYALGKIWNPMFNSNGKTLPTLDKNLPFPNGTVVIKVLYTQTTREELSMLRDAPQVRIRVFKDENLNDNRCPEQKLSTPKELATLRLLQFDVAVRTPDAPGTVKPEGSGWVFMTFVYDGRLAGGDPWGKLQPVGLTWGNDPWLDDEMARQGQKPKETKMVGQVDFRLQLGRGGRLNGPLDDPRSACISCHTTAQIPANADMKPPVLNAALDPAQRWNMTKCWFRNLESMQAFGSIPKGSLDYCLSLEDKKDVPESTDSSLQLAAALQNVRAAPEKQGKAFSWLNLDGGPATSDTGSGVFPISRD